MSVSTTVSRRAAPLVAAFLAAAGFVSLARGEGTMDKLLLIAPDSVWAGTTIFGCVVGGECPMSIEAMWWGDTMPGFPQTLPGDPLFFTVPTTEPMSGSNVRLLGGDANGQRVVKYVEVI